MKARCPRCRLHTTLCICADIPRLETRTRVVLVMHRFEHRKSTNTGRLAAECLPNSEILVRGLPSLPSRLFVAPPGTLPVVLFPDADAVSLAELANSPQPITLIVPDGTWRQAGKVRARVPGLSDFLCASLPYDGPTRYRLRAETKAGGLATMEAIARALGILEVDGPAIRKQLEALFGTWVDRALMARGLQF